MNFSFTRVKSMRNKKREATLFSGQQESFEAYISFR